MFVFISSLHHSMQVEMVVKEIDNIPGKPCKQRFAHMALNSYPHLEHLLDHTLTCICCPYGLKCNESMIFLTSNHIYFKSPGAF